MIVLLIFTIFLLASIALFQLQMFRKSQAEHKLKIKLLHQVIAELSQDQAASKIKMELSDELLAKLRRANVMLNREISGVVSDMAETLSAHDLL